MEENQFIARPFEGGHYDKRFIGQVVAEVIGGKSMRMVCEEYSVKRTTVLRWLGCQDLENVPKRLKRVVPMSLRRTIVRSVQAGRISIREAQITYGIRSADTIKKWVMQMEQENPELVDQTDEPMATDKSAKKSSSTDQQAEVKALQKALQEAQLKIAALNTLIDVAEEQLKINIRKKPGAKPSND